jgi:hypothetical protein
VGSAVASRRLRPTPITVPRSPTTAPTGIARGSGLGGGASARQRTLVVGTHGQAHAFSVG